ncbi:MAG: NADH-quinone oxidoreductase subunit NuoG [Chloroflexi bacterium]|nr:NADH-quinone oxidoreductase subunit NuoG [Chloroflexota bacterium]
MPFVTIDDKKIEIPAGTLVVEAAKKIGNAIPVFCYHPKLAPVGMCRMCLVEIGTPRRGKDGQIEKDASGNDVIAWLPKLQTACTTVVSDGMVVRTATLQVTDARRGVVEFLLTSHPLDCPVCDKGGECPLQNVTMAYGPGNSRFPAELKFHNEKRVPLGDLIMLDRERCIQCARCIRFQDEIAGEPALGFNARGRGMEIVALGDPPFNSKFSGNTIDICPVGALTSRDFRLTARVWEVNDAPSVCAHCSVGCNISISERDHQIKRITPRENEAVNEIWICDKGRFAHHFTTAPDRLTTPMLRDETGWHKVSWFDASATMATRFNEIKSQFGVNALGGIAGDRVPNEDLYLFQKFFRDVIGSPHLDHRVGWSAANAGAGLVRQFGAGVETNLGALDKNVAVLVLGADVEEEQPVLRLRLSASAKRGAHLIVANPRVTKLAEHAKQSIVYSLGSEVYFLLGMLRAVAEERLDAPHRDWMAARVGRFEETKKEIERFTVEQYAELCHVKPEKIRAAARAFAQAPDALILFGREAMHTLQRDAAVESLIAALLLVTGHVGRKNNGAIALYPHNNSTGAIDMGILPDRAAGRVEAKAKGFSAAELTNAKTKAVWVMGADPAAHGKFSKPNFLVVSELFMTETAKLADVVLPAQSFAERDGTFTNTERRVQLFRAAIKPLGDAKPDWWTIQELANHLGARWDYRGAKEIMDEIAARVPLYAGMTHEKLAANVTQPRAPYGQGNPSDSPTEIAMGELEGMVSGIAWKSIAESDAGAKFELQIPSPKFQVPSPQSSVDNHQFVLAVSRALYDKGTLVSKTKIVQPRVLAPRIEINSLDAEELGIENGARVRVSFEARALELIAHVDGHVPPGTVLIAQNLDGTANLPMGALVKVERT